MNFGTGSVQPEQTDPPEEEKPGCGSGSEVLTSIILREPCNLLPNCLDQSWFLYYIVIQNTLRTFEHPWNVNILVHF